MKVVKSAILFCVTEGKHLYGFYDEGSYERHMAKWNDPCNAECMAFEVHPEVACYIRDHCMTDEMCTEEYVCNELED